MKALVLAILALAGPVRAADSPVAPPELSHGDKFGEQTGAELYANVCQACHMQDGQGATGAGHYPALAANEKLGAAGYPLTLVLHGQGAMPPIGRMMTDDQVAEVVNYVRTHFGNSYADAVTAADVKAAR